MKTIFAAAAATALLIPASQAAAQLVGTVKVRAGIGVQTQPDYLGADRNAITAYPNIAVAFGEKPFGVGAPDDSLSIKLLGNGGFSAGVAGQLRRGRKDSDVGSPVGDVNRTVELGLFAQQYIGESFRLRAEGLKGIGGHDGLVGSVGADYVVRDGDKYAFTIGPRVRLADADFHSAFFGVRPEVSILTALPVYRPDGGVYAVGATAGANYAIGGGWGLFGYARYDRLVGDARRSPIVRQFGSPDQFSAGIGINRTFTIKL